MKKLLVLLLIIVAIALPVSADSDSSKGVDMGKGHTKLGGYVGTGVGVTVGFDNGKTGEWNVFAGYDYNYSYPMVSAGVNYLFTLVDINIGDQIFPLSLGPQLSVGYWWDPVTYLFYYDDKFGGLYTEALAVVRWEYTFWFPMNLYAEFGAGVGMRFGETWNDTDTLHVGFAYSAAIGVRYVFGM